MLLKAPENRLTPRSITSVFFRPLQWWVWCYLYLDQNRKTLYRNCWRPGERRRFQSISAAFFPGCNPKYCKTTQSTKPMLYNSTTQTKLSRRDPRENGRETVCCWGVGELTVACDSWLPDGPSRKIEYIQRVLRLLQFPISRVYARSVSCHELFFLRFLFRVNICHRCICSSTRRGCTRKNSGVCGALPSFRSSTARG